jgi:hypothetical protein
VKAAAPKYYPAPAATKIQAVPIRYPKKRKPKVFCAVHMPLEKRRSWHERRSEILPRLDGWTAAHTNFSRRAARTPRNLEIVEHGTMKCMPLSTEIRRKGNQQSFALFTCRSTNERSCTVQGQRYWPVWRRATITSFLILIVTGWLRNTWTLENIPLRHLQSHVQSRKSLSYQSWISVFWHHKINHLSLERNR